MPGGIRAAKLKSEVFAQNVEKRGQVPVTNLVCDPLTFCCRDVWLARFNGCGSFPVWVIACHHPHAHCCVTQKKKADGPALDPWVIGLLVFVVAGSCTRHIQLFPFFLFFCVAALFAGVVSHRATSQRTIPTYRHPAGLLLSYDPATYIHIHCIRTYACRPLSSSTACVSGVCVCVCVRCVGLWLGV
jgi:hypothetical protein